MKIEVSVPGLLRDCTGGRNRFELEAETVSGAIEALFAAYPLLRVHVYDEAGEVRRHVLLFYNDDNIAWMESLDVPLRAGDKLHVFQAVSGG